MTTSALPQRALGVVRPSHHRGEDRKYMTPRPLRLLGCGTVDRPHQ